MPVIGGAFSGGFDRRRFVTLELFRGLAQRNKGRKTSYFDGPIRPDERRDNPGTPPEVEAGDGIVRVVGRQGFAEMKRPTDPLLLAAEYAAPAASSLCLVRCIPFTPRAGRVDQVG